MSTPQSEFGLAAPTTRRRFITLSGAAAALALTTGLPQRSEATVVDRKLPSDPFRLGVASGDPLPDAVVLWTRLAPQPLEPYGGMDQNTWTVQWELALDQRFTRGVRRGEGHAHPAYTHSVHVDARDLRPDTEYFYRFHAGGYSSQVGRTKTAPLAGASRHRMSFAIASCQAYTDGYYTALHHLAQEDLDVVFFLGDYIYEYGIDAHGGYRNLSTTLPSTLQEETTTLDRYRLQYSLYKSDPDLIEAHQAAPWIVTWDDHEVENNYAAAISENNEPTTDFLVRRANAYRAYWEHMPLRRPQQPQGPDMRLYRRFRYGQLANFSVLDTRQYRSDQANGDGVKPDSPERRDPARTMVGAAQEKWLLDGLATSDTRWNVVPQQVAMSMLDHAAGDPITYPMDTWDGYYASKQRILQGVVDRDVDNFVVLTGDAHRNFAFDIKSDFLDPDSATIGVELLGTSISSGRDGADNDSTAQLFLAENPHLKFCSSQRGYVRCTLAPDQLRADFRVLPYVIEQGAPISTRTSFVVESGRPGLQPV